MSSVAGPFLLVSPMSSPIYICKCDLNYITFSLILIKNILQSQSRQWKFNFKEIRNKKVSSLSHGNVRIYRFMYDRMQLHISVIERHVSFEISLFYPD